MSLRVLIDDYYKKKFEIDERIINIENTILKDYKDRTIFTFKILLDKSKGGEYNCCYHEDQKNIMRGLINFCKENDFYLNFGIIYIENKEYYLDIVIDIKTELPTN